MMKSESRSVPFFAVAAIAALVILAALLGTGGLVLSRESARHKAALEAGYERAFCDLCDSANNLEVNLSKLLVASGEAESLPLIADVNAQAELASSSLAGLPLDPVNVRKTAKYFNQAADWARSYSKAIARGKSSRPYTEQAETLYTAAREVNARLRELAAEAGGHRIADSVGAAERLIGLDLDLSFGDMESNGIDYPELIYDGPFSDSKKFRFHALDGLAAVSEEQAAERAGAAGLENVRLLGRTEGKTVLYMFGGTVEGGDAQVSITEKGGLVAGYDRTKPVGAVKLTREEACRRATAEAERLGYGGLAPVWYNAENGVGFVNLAPQNGGVTYYTDLVKAKIALDDGELLGLEATGWCSAHRERALDPAVTENTVRALVGDKLNIVKISLAVIPDGDDERFCYEVYGSRNDLDYFVYYDAVTGAQADVLRVIDSSQGSMVM